MNELQQEFFSTLSFCHVSPYDVIEIIAGWSEDDTVNNEWSSGFVVRTNAGYAYLVSKRNHRLRSTRAVTRRFDAEPTFLYERARRWNFNKEELNANLPLAKQEANYPSANRKSGGEACSRTVLRIPATQPGA